MAVKVLKANIQCRPCKLRENFTLFLYAKVKQKAQEGNRIVIIYMHYVWFLKFSKTCVKYRIIKQWISFTSVLQSALDLSGV